MISEQIKAELKIILEEEYGLKLKPRIILEVANNLIGFFGLLEEIDSSSHKDKMRRS
ncbi:MAG TPA: hypothetical protein VJ044_02090 [Candidatus Hodarchaeales archaeon]|nr:hypothetical protein [Candidatus Hodarchaeales archaeon]